MWAWSARLLFVSLATGSGQCRGAQAAETAEQPAKQIFGAARTCRQFSRPGRSAFTPRAVSPAASPFPTDGETWQAMRLSRNRRWGHPDLIALVEKLSREAAAKDGWPGLLVGDIAQPRGGPDVVGACLAPGGP
jgi:penicillin-insensitive murein endopeptidase